MIVDKAPPTHYFKWSWVEFHKDRKTKELQYRICSWNHDGTMLSVISEGPVGSEYHLKHLQGLTKLTDILDFDVKQSQRSVEN